MLRLIKYSPENLFSVDCSNRSIYIYKNPVLPCRAFHKRPSTASVICSDVVNQLVSRAHPCWILHAASQYNLNPHRYRFTVMTNWAMPSSLPLQLHPCTWFKHGYQVRKWQQCVSWHLIPTRQRIFFILELRFSMLPASSRPHLQEPLLKPQDLKPGQTRSPSNSALPLFALVRSLIHFES